MSNDLDRLGREQASGKDVQIAELETELQTEKDRRRRDHYYWIFGAIVAINLFQFPAMQHGLAIFGILMLELIVLIVAGKALGMDDVVVLLNKAWSGLLRRKDD